MEESHHYSELIIILSRCLLIFGIAGLIVPIFNRIHVSPVLGFLVSGIILSPHTLGDIEGNFGFLDGILNVEEKTVNLLGELGIISLLFMIGLELSFEKLREMKRYIFGLGTSQIVVTGLIISSIALVFGNSFQASIIIGTGFALSSTAIVMQLLQEYNLTRRSIGQTSFSILLMQDIAIVPILILIGAFSAETVGDQTTGLLLIKALLMAVVCIGSIYFIGKKLLQPAIHSIAGTKKDEWLVAFTLFVLCLITLITIQAGLSAALGAFLAGLLIAETEFRDRIEKMLYPLKSILLGVFFISIGMMVNITEIFNNSFWLVLSAAGIFLIKGFTLYPVVRLFGIKSSYAAEISAILSQPGEFTLMTISLSMAVGLIPVESAQFFLLVAVIGMLFMPFLFHFLPTVRAARKES